MPRCRNTTMTVKDTFIRSDRSSWSDFVPFHKFVPPATILEQPVSEPLATSDPAFCASDHHLDRQEVPTWHLGSALDTCLPPVHPLPLPHIQITTTATVNHFKGMYLMGRETLATKCIYFNSFIPELEPDPYSKEDAFCFKFPLIPPAQMIVQDLASLFFNWIDKFCAALRNTCCGPKMSGYVLQGEPQR